MEKEQIQYITILKTARATLEGKDPEEVAKKSGAEYDSERQVFTVITYGRKIELSYPGWETTQEINPWHLATLIQYLGNANGIEPSGNFMPLREYRDGGHTRGASFDSAFEKEIEEGFGKLGTKDIIEAAKKLGGTEIKGKGDVCMVFNFAPYFPVQMNYWEPDDEFPASGRLLCDTTAENFLGVEAAGFAMDLLITYILELKENCL